MNSKLEEEKEYVKRWYKTNVNMDTNVKITVVTTGENLFPPKKKSSTLY